MTKKKPEQNPIEEAIGKRAKKSEEPKTEVGKIIQTPAKVAEGILSPTPQTPPKPDEPTPSEMVTLEELNHETVERLQDQYPEEPLTQEEKRILQNPEIPVSKPESQPATKTCSPESPVQTARDRIKEVIEEAVVENLPVLPPQETKISQPSPPEGANGSPILIDEQPPQVNENAIGALEDFIKEAIPELRKENLYPPAEDKELTALKKYIMGSGFVPTGVAYHIVALCSQPMTTPCTTTWDFKDRAMVPEMVFTLLRQPGYLEGIWPSLRIIMSSNIGNDSWCAGISTTIAFFDVIRSLPVVKELAQQK